MTIVSQQTILDRYKENMVNHAACLADIQSRLMDSRRLDLDRLTSRISLEITGQNPASSTPRHVLFDTDWLKEFALGDITRCLGKEFTIYAGRKSPRIPNGDLMLISRIVEINGSRGDFSRPSTITAEYDVSPDAWFFSDHDNGNIPVSILMEVALQPCGVLSAWLHTQLRYPQVDFSFRNLDGTITMLDPALMRGRTITTRAVLDRTSFSGSTIIQHFNFSLSCDGRIFLKGETTFGYFPEAAMAAQSGLDNGRQTLPRGDNPEILPGLTVISRLADRPGTTLPGNKLRMIDSIAIEKNRQSGRLEYVQSSRQNSPSDWYYVNHFLGDPVMPGSLGVEAIFQAIASAIKVTSGNAGPIRSACGHEMKWKYRGQVLPSNKMVHFDVQVSDVENTSSGTRYTASANLWADNLRIYEISNLSLIQLPKEN